MRLIWKLALYSFWPRPQLSDSRSCWKVRPRYPDNYNSPLFRLHFLLYFKRASGYLVNYIDTFLGNKIRSVTFLCSAKSNITALILSDFSLYFWQVTDRFSVFLSIEFNGLPRPRVIPGLSLLTFFFPEAFRPKTFRPFVERDRHRYTASSEFCDYQNDNFERN